MSEDGVSHKEAGGAVQRGQWTEFAKFQGWKGPEDAIRYVLGGIRRDPTDSLRTFELEEPESGEIKQETQLPLATELKMLFAGGTIGRDPQQSIVTIDEFLTAAPEVWGLTPEQVTELRDTTLPEVEAWLRGWDARKEERKQGLIEGENRFILETWGQERFRILIDQVLPHAPGIDLPALTTFQNLHGNDLLLAFDAAEAGLAIEDPAERRQIMEDSVATILGFAASVTRLHPEELRKIAERERYRGYLFLDSIAEQWQTFDDTYDEIDSQEDAFRDNKVFIAEGPTWAALHQREAAVKSLRYGAQNAHSVQDADSYLRGEGRQVGNETNTLPPEPSAEE